MRRSFFLLLLLMFCLSSCARIRVWQDAEFRNADKLLNEKRYGEAVGAFSKIAKESAGTARGANALFSSASVRVFFDNPDKDYALSLQEFDEFLRLYPNDERAGDAQNWRHIVKTVLELKKENERLSKNIDQLKRIDIRHEERRRTP